MNKQLVAIKPRKEPKEFNLTWVVNNICTNHCRYCPSMLHRGKNHHYSWADAQRFSQYLLDRYPNINLAISGGEPTVSPWLKDLINLYLDRGHRVGLTSNGVRAGSYWDDCRPSYICLSYHPAFDDGEWVNRARATGERIGKTTVRLMMDPLYWSQCLRVYRQLWTETALGIELVRIVNWGEDSQPPTYRPAELDLMTRLPSRSPPPDSDPQLPPSTAVWSGGLEEDAGGIWANNLISRDLNHFEGWQCDIGLDSLFVQFDGSYKRGNCPQGEYLGRVDDSEYTLPQTSVICQQWDCRCTTDILTAKRIIPILPAVAPSCPTSGEAA